MLFSLATGGAMVLHHRPPEQAVECKAQGHPDDRPVQRLLDANLVRTLLFQHDEIDEQGGQHGSDEKQPRPVGAMVSMDTPVY